MHLDFFLESFPRGRNYFSQAFEKKSIQFVFQKETFLFCFDIFDIPAIFLESEYTAFFSTLLCVVA